MTKNILITGGCRSGKSRHALSLAKQFSKKVYLATAEALDKEMIKRIARHREERGKDWVTVEEPIDIGAALEREGNRAEVIVVDCLTLWISNLLMQKKIGKLHFQAGQGAVEYLRQGEGNSYIYHQRGGRWNSPGK